MPCHRCLFKFQDIRGAGITGSSDRDWAPNPAYDFSVKSFDSKPQDGYDKFDLKRMARERMGQDQGATKQAHDSGPFNVKNQSQALQRQLLEQQIAENAARKEVKFVDLLVVFFSIICALQAMRVRLAKQEALDEERISRQINAQNGGHSNDRSPPSRAIIRFAQTP